MTSTIRLVRLITAIVAGPALSLSAAAQTSEAEEHFEKAVRPVLVEHCIKCHGGDKPKGDLRLDTTKGLRNGVFGEPIFVPGDPDASAIVQAVRYDDPFLTMPPSGKLPDEAVRAIERWIELGADVPDSMGVEAADLMAWNFLPPVPLDEAPATEAGRDRIDVELEAQLKSEGIELSAPAPPLRWLRRVTFDLTGLPPTPQECDAFSATGGTKAARAAVVDRLLASPAYGERWARRWLDLVRYAETRAHEFDFPIPNAFEYRDYVIRAFEADVPYDRLVTEFLAGDLVEEARLDPTGAFDESPLGTGAWFLGEEVHSPVDLRGDQTDRHAHQVEVLSKSVLALGVACARCHDHKFDPISAEDYHALAGFALSTAQAQVRFETEAHNRGLADRLARFLDASQPSATAAVAEALEAEAEGLAPLLVEVAKRIGEREPSAPPVQGSVTPASVAALDALAGARLPLLLEDFEAPTLDAAGLGPWEATGDAFMTRPLSPKDTALRQDFKQRGTGSVNSYAGTVLPRNNRGSDRFLGTLTSRPFPAARRYLHLLVNGGDVDGVRVEVIDAESGEALGKVHGKRSDQLAPARIDLNAYQGRQVRLRFVDEHSQAWGQIGGDHVVLSDEEHASALDAARSLDEWSLVLGEVEHSPHDEVQAAGVVRALAWEYALQNSPTSPLRWLVEPPEQTPAQATARGHTRNRAPTVPYGELQGTRWIVNGPGFGPGPMPPGRVVFDVDPVSQEASVATITTEPSAVAHPMWADLKVAPGAANSRVGSIDWVQSGRTLVTPTFVSSSGRLGHLVRGRAKVLLVVAGHKMIHGPLPKGVIKSIDTGGDWAWIEHSVESAAGLRARLEITALGRTAFEIAATVDLDPVEPLPTLSSADGWWHERAADEELDFTTIEHRAQWLEGSLRDAAQLLRTGGVPERVIGDGERATLLRVAEDVARLHPGVRASIASALKEPTQALAAIVESRALESRLAPAAIELEGFDEYILDRGGWRTPGELAPRRAPSALRVSDEPLARDGEGSGRLALAQSLIQSPTKTLQRVWVNRLWQSLFGVGLVATPDDFGAMGAKPSHLGILDQLALDFEASGWSTKALVRRLALSDAYARASEPTASGAELDPLNVNLGRMPVRRLQAEEIRDALLAASGELDSTRFGPPVPIHLTEFMTGRGRPKSSGPLDGAGRRSIYLEVRRNFLHPFLTVFDSPNPSTCRGKRNSSNVPAQALTLLNDPFVEERAEHLADLVLAANSAAQRLDVLWLRVLGRQPTADERTIWGEYLESAPDGARAAWVDLAHALFNVKDFLFLR